MDNGKISGWLREQNEIFAAATAAREELALAEMTIRAEGPQYWAYLIDELGSVARNLTPGLLGNFLHSDFAVSKFEDHCRLEIAFLGGLYRASYADLWYRPDGNKIRCRTTLSEKELSFSLCVVEGRICTATQSHPQPMDAESMAELIAKPMIRYAMAGALVSA